MRTTSVASVSSLYAPLATAPSAQSGVETRIWKLSPVWNINLLVQRRFSENLFFIPLSLKPIHISDMPVPIDRPNVASSNAPYLVDAARKDAARHDSRQTDDFE